MFKEWTLKNKDRYISNPIKDFIGDVECDTHFPKSNNKYYISKYLRKHGACDNAIKGFNILWDDFIKSTINK